jgi:hypothetical protein
MGIRFIKEPNGHDVNRHAMPYGDPIPVSPGQTSGSTGFDVASHLTNRDLAEHAELIVIGQCVDTKITWIERNLYTLAVVDVRETLKGDQNVTVTVAVPGGVDANRRFPVAMSYPGAPRLSPREEVFLFLTPAAEITGAYAVIGVSQGKFSIMQDEHGTALVSRNLTGLTIEGNTGTVRRRDGAVSLRSFKQEIEGYLKPPL